MSYTLTDLATDIKATLKADKSRAGKEAICKHVSRALLDKEFVAENLKTRASGEKPRQVLYEDPELGFCICGHVHDGPAASPAHDHGPSWAIYGQAEGETIMSEWKIVEKGDPILVEQVRSHVMKPGEAYFYDVGDVHAVDRKAPVKLIRIEGSNLDHIKRSNIKQKAA
jgi:hypothetical protein